MVTVERCCANGSCEKPGKHLCSGCNEEIYCSKDCQKSHWLLHKHSCQNAAKPVSVTSFESLSVKQLKILLKVKATAFESNKKTAVLDLLEKIVEKPQLIKLVEEHVKLSEVETLLSVSDANGKSSSGSSSSSSSSSSGSRSQATKKTKDSTSRTATQPQPVPTPDQLRQQAAMIRKDPESIRRANVAFQKMTDDQIRAYADQLEQAASDPMMMKEVERMAQLTPKERSQLQSIQDGLQGLKPMDDSWLDAAIATLKSNPGFYKGMVKGKGALFGGVSDEQIESFVDTAAMMDASTLKWILKAIKYLSSWAKPLTDLYNTIDKYTYGFGKHILLGIVAIIVYQSVLLWIALGKIFMGYVFGWYKAVAGVPVTEAITAATVSGAAATSNAAAAIASGGAAVGAKIVEEAITAALPVGVPVKEVKEEKKNRWGMKPNKKEAKSTDGEAADSEFSF